MTFLYKWRLAHVRTSTKSSLSKNCLSGARLASASRPQALGCWLKSTAIPLLGISSTWGVATSDRFAGQDEVPFQVKTPMLGMSSTLKKGRLQQQEIGLRGCEKRCYFKSRSPLSGKQALDLRGGKENGTFSNGTNKSDTVTAATGRGKRAGSLQTTPSEKGWDAAKEKRKRARYAAPAHDGKKK